MGYFFYHSVTYQTEIQHALHLAHSRAYRALEKIRANIYNNLASHPDIMRTIGGQPNLKKASKCLAGDSRSMTIAREKARNAKRKQQRYPLRRSSRIQARFATSASAAPKHGTCIKSEPTDTYTLMSLSDAVSSRVFKYKCLQCGKPYISATGLYLHKIWHTGKRPHKCNNCDKCFSYISYLKKHQKTHSGERPFKCTNCDRCFASSYSLKHHQTIHSGEKRYKCEDCGVSFRCSSTLVRHKRTHTGERPYKCQICEKCFAQLATLRRHELIHSDEKPFACDECGWQFKRAGNLKQHKKRHINNSASALNVTNIFSTCSIFSNRKKEHWLE